jgi:hypothetical protein
MEPTFDVTGARLPPDPAGADTEAVAVLADGSFWVAEEYGPSLIKVDDCGIVRRRWTPKGVELPGGDDLLPARGAERRMNRGFEGLAASPNGAWLYAAFQSALDRPGADRRLTTIWKLDAETGELAGEFDYPFEPPQSFTADAAAGDVGVDDLKICELAAVGHDRLLVLERISRSARIYRVDLAGGRALAKTLIFSTDAAGAIAADLEGMVLMSDRELILATDNDFGIERAETRFYRLRFEAPLAG